MSIATEITRLQGAKADLKTSIESKGVTVPSSAKLDDYASYVDDIQQGGGGQTQTKSLTVTQNGSYTVLPDTGYTLSEVDVDVSVSGSSVENPAVRFLDYDGTVISELTQSELDNLTALPNPPDHSTDSIPLTFDEWNWDLADIKTFRTSVTDFPVNVGANYHTTDGKLHIICDVYSQRTSSPTTDGSIFLATINGMVGSIEVDWGEGGATETFTSGGIRHRFSSDITDCHITMTYIPDTPTPGDYCTLTFASGCYTLIKEIKSADNFFISSTWHLYGHLQSLSMPSNAGNADSSLMEGDYKDSRYMKWISLPKHGLPALSVTRAGLKYQPLVYDMVTSQFDVDFTNCYWLEEAYWPDDSTYVFNYCTSLRHVNVPTTKTSIRANTFAYCTALKELTLPSDVRSITSGAFTQCPARLTIKRTFSRVTLNNEGDASFFEAILVPVTQLSNYLSTATSNKWSSNKARIYPDNSSST